jgi:redox-regulated HSP33 family molecular chaperone
MGKLLVVFILDLCLSALLSLESKLIVAACWDASVIRAIFRVRNVRNVRTLVQNEDDKYFSHL